MCELSKEQFINKLEELIEDIKLDKAKFGKIEFIVRYEDEEFEPIFEDGEFFFENSKSS